MSAPQENPPLYFTDLPFEQALAPEVLNLWRLPQYTQRTPEWYEARMKCISASDIANALKQTKDACEYFEKCFSHLDNYDFVRHPSKCCNHYGSVRDLIEKKCNLGPPFTGNDHTRHGQKFEPIVTNIYSQLHQVDMLEFGLLLHPTVSFLAASPDGISLDGVMLEIKCPTTRQVRNHPPLWYFQQILVQLDCTGLRYCDFMDCNFVEFPNHSDWLEEATLWENANPNAKHHIYGCMLTHYASEQPDSATHYYAPPTVNRVESFAKWTEEEKRKHPEKTLVETFYKLQEYHICRIEADPTWVPQNLSAISAVWDQVIKGRTEKGLQSLIDAKQQRKRNPPKDKFPNGHSLDINASYIDNGPQYKLHNNYLTCLL